MEALADLVPRQAGEVPVEVRVAFDSVEQAAHAADRCPISCVCTSATANCYGTGNSYYA